VKLVKVKPVYGNKRAKCPDCKETYDYPASEENLLFDEYGRPRSESGEWAFRKYHKCKKQSSLGRFIKE